MVTGNLLTNDIDPEGDKFSLISTTAPSSGTLITDSAGNFTYTPFPNFFGTDSFTYTIQDAKGVTDTAKVTLTFTPVNDVDAVNDTFSAKEDTKLIGPRRACWPTTSIPTPTPSTSSRSPASSRSTPPSTKGGTVDVQGRRLVRLYAGRQLPGRRHVHLHDLRRRRRHRHGHGDDQRRRSERRAGRGGRHGDGRRGLDEQLHPGAGQRHRHRRRPARSSRRSRRRTTARSRSSRATTKAGGGVHYTPNANFFGTDTFTYTISDGNGGTDTATVTVIVSERSGRAFAGGRQVHRDRRRDGDVYRRGADRQRLQPRHDDAGRSRRCSSRRAARSCSMATASVTFDPNAGLHGRRQIRVRGGRRQQGRPRPGDDHLHAGQRSADRGQRHVRHRHQHGGHGHLGPGAGQRQRRGRRHADGGRREQRLERHGGVQHRRTARSRSARPRTSSARAASTTPSPTARAALARAW